MRIIISNVLWFIFIFLLFIVMLLIGALLQAFKLKAPSIPNRSSHSKDAYLGGGLYISIGLLLLIFLFNLNTEVRWIIFGAIIFGVIGIIDDFFIINFKSKLIVQILITSIFLYWNNLYLIKLDFGFITISIGWIGLIISTLAVLLVINAFNYFDGLDGLYLFMFLTMVIILKTLLQGSDYKDLFLALGIMCLIFIIANFAMIGIPKQFLGDGGNYILSFFISSFYLHSIQTNNFPVDFKGQVFGLWFFGLLFFEFLAVGIIRLLQKKSIFSPDRSHLHHLILVKFNQHALASFITTIIYLLLTLIGLVMTIYYPNFSFALFIFLMVVYLFIRVRPQLNK